MIKKKKKGNNESNETIRYPQPGQRNNLPSDRVVTQFCISVPSQGGSLNVPSVPSRQIVPSISYNVIRADYSRGWRSKNRLRKLLAATRTFERREKISVINFQFFSRVSFVNNPDGFAALSCTTICMPPPPILLLSTARSSSRDYLRIRAIKTNE